MNREKICVSKANRSFWLIGLLNNVPWVLMLACATNISSGGVALVFLSNQIPGLVVKITAPYWFHNVSYRVRMLMSSVSMGVASLLVACGGLLHDETAEGKGSAKDFDGLGLALELIGVSFISFQCSLGEASMLALAGKFDSVILPQMNTSSYSLISQVRSAVGKSNRDFRDDDAIILDGDAIMHNNSAQLSNDSDQRQQNRCITAFSSGTGLAGILGYGYKYLLSDMGGLSLSMVVFSVELFALAYYATFYFGLNKFEEVDFVGSSEIHHRGVDDFEHQDIPTVQNMESPLFANIKLREQLETASSVEMVEHLTTKNVHTFEKSPSQLQQAHMTVMERFYLVLSLWRYTVPLFTVYLSEYMLQAGVWSAIGFPVTSSVARAQFYHYSNWTYQVGVFVSRSSGNLFHASLTLLWTMPLLQVTNLIFFWLDSIHHFWYDYSVLVLCLFAGLLGGSVYVQGYSRINLDVPIEIREFSLASAGVADSLGILLADVVSLFIQSCIYDRNRIEGAVVSCPSLS
eukprot:CCRYP_013706-RB/>CCRYP_013706-RB protein AED:0.05 eAED:0.05 QI:382/0.66/0.75/1/0/0.25/4/80/517